MLRPGGRGESFIGLPGPWLILFHLLNISSTLHAVGKHRDDFACLSCLRLCIPFLDEQPVSLICFLVSTAAHADQCPSALQFFPIQTELQHAVTIAVLCIMLGMPGSAIPDQHRTGSILLR